MSFLYIIDVMILIYFLDLISEIHIVYNSRKLISEFEFKFKFKLKGRGNEVDDIVLVLVILILVLIQLILTSIFYIN